MCQLCDDEATWAQLVYRVESTARSGSQRAVDTADEAIEAALSYLD